MALDLPTFGGQRIAIVGGGIAGLAAAYLLSRSHCVSVFEAEPSFGGHARTITAGLNGDQPVDTGFIVFNYVNYPHLTRMFLDLDVPVERSDMSFGASVDNGNVEYALRSIPALLGQRRNIIRPPFFRMIRDILRFNAGAERAATSDSVTIGEVVSDLKLGRWFQDYYLTPVCGAIWSTPADEIHRFPARSLLQFFRNHALLNAKGQHQWWTVKGGSVEYVSRLTHHLKGRGVILRPGTPVHSVSRDENGVTVHTAARPAECFDKVVFASHSDQTLRLLDRPTPAEATTLSNIRYQDNQMVLHRDVTQMPRRRACWSSWVYRAESGRRSDAIGVTYWMNRLQNIPESDPLFVSLNPVGAINEDMIYDQKTFRHPVFDRAALRAQAQISAIQGQNRTWFAGAYLRHGFHEDGFASAVRVARQMEKTTV